MLNTATTPSPPAPTRRPPRAWPRMRAAPRDAKAPGRTPERLLVVDDDLGSIEHLGHLLKGFAQISFATTGEDALRLARQQQPDLVLLDIELPGIDGFEVCRRLRATPGLQALPIVFASQHGDAATEARALRVGADDFLRKPFNAPLLRQRLRRLLDRPAPQDDIDAPQPGTASMLSYAVHEMGNPVNAIRGFAQLMQAAPLPAGQAERLDHILEAAERLKGLLADMSDVARMESGRFNVETDEVELAGFVREACRPAQAQAAQAGVALNLPARRGPVRVRADARRLRQCLDNLLSNALKYGHAGGRIDVGIEADGGEVVLAVQDHGDGLSDSQIAHLFEPYNRLGRDAGAIPGTGLGLALTQHLMRAMGGRLRVHSEGAGQGCRFELLLKAADD